MHDIRRWMLLGEAGENSVAGKDAREAYIRLRRVRPDGSQVVRIDGTGRGCTEYTVDPTIALNTLVERQNNSLDIITTDMKPGPREPRATKSGHWIWWCFPTFFQGTAEATHARDGKDYGTYLTEDTATKLLTHSNVAWIMELRAVHKCLKGWIEAPRGTLSMYQVIRIAGFAAVDIERMTDFGEFWTGVIRKFEGGGGGLGRRETTSLEQQLTRAKRARRDAERHLDVAREKERELEDRIRELSQRRGEKKLTF